ncbi:MAG: ribonuclease D [Syntrophales bacterium]|nr:ribonuclease D [Syntrophales bacterium]
MEKSDVQVVWIDDYGRLEKAVDSIMRCSFVSVDTEYDSFHHFREKLCLIQLATDQGFYLIDPLGIEDLRLLGKIFSHRGILKIFHAGENDIRLLKRDYGFFVDNIFDTAKAASLLGEERLSLQGLVNKYLSVAFDKKKCIRLSRWDKRPLSDTQIKYAIEDVKYLFDLYLVLYRELVNKGCLEQAKEAFAEVARVDWQARTFRPNKYVKISGAENLTGAERRRLRALYEWRYFLAVDLDVAPFMILTDQELVAVAKGGIEALPPKKQRQWGEEIKRSVIYFRD